MEICYKTYTFNIGTGAIIGLAIMSVSSILVAGLLSSREVTHVYKSASKMIQK